MAQPARSQWFAVHVLSGQEQKVHDNIVKRIKTEEMGELIFEVLIPTERISEVKRGKRTETVRKLLPGYLIINMHLLDEQSQLVDRTWYFIRETPGVIGFAGTKEVGETVKVADGPFQNQSGVVEEIDPERGKLRVSVSIFGRSTPVELEYWQVERS